jgi:hypothetical protein
LEKKAFRIIKKTCASIKRLKNRKKFLGKKKEILHPRAVKVVGVDQGCQIFLGTKYQNGKNIPNYHEPNVHKV